MKGVYKMKRILSLAMSGALLITSIPLPVSAAAITKDSVVYDTAIGLNEARTLAYDNSSVVLGSVGEAQAVKGEASDKSLEEAIKAVRSKISVTKTYSEFDYYFNVSNSYEGTTWNLSWRNPDNGSYVRVACDNSGNIISYRHYDATNRPGDDRDHATSGLSLRRLAPHHTEDHTSVSQKVLPRSASRYRS